MFSTRRSFLKTGATVATGIAAGAAICAPTSLFAYGRSAPQSAPPIEDPHVKQLVLVAIDTARSAGATYADIRLTHMKQRRYEMFGSDDRESMTVGVRALVDGYWGFASGAIWNKAEMARLGRTAVGVARTNALGKPRVVELAPIPIVQDGHWETPVSVNPFDVSREEITDFCNGFVDFGSRFGLSGIYECVFVVTNKAFGSTDGSYWTQRTFRTGGSFSLSVGRGGGLGGLGVSLDKYLSPAGEGWERFRDQPLREGIRQLHEELTEDVALPVKPVDVGRYDAVLDAASLAELVNGSIGAATQLDRALGYEANAGGTSYLNDPDTMLGTLQIGAPILTVVANRNAVGAANTVQWDDDGVVPESVTLVKDGRLENFSTSREGAGWMREILHRDSLPSSGCAAAPEGIDAPLTHTPNLVMQPSESAGDFETFCATLENGVAIKRSNFSMDFQQLNGFGRGDVFEVRGGKRVALLAGAGLLIRAPEFWNSLQSIGDARSVERYGRKSSKGEPPQSMYNSVDVVPVAVKGITVIDVMRKG